MKKLLLLTMLSFSFYQGQASAMMYYACECDAMCKNQSKQANCASCTYRCGNISKNTPLFIP